MRRFLVERWFLLALVLVLLAGFGWPQELAPLAGSRALREGWVALVMFLMALPLEAHAIVRSVRSPGPALLATGVNQVLIPLLAVVAQGITASVLPLELGYGLLVTAATPCTIASAAVWTRKGGGNPAVAVLVTLITNLLCFALAPLLLWLMLHRVAAIGSPADMAGGLALVVLLPLVMAQLARRNERVARWATRNAVPLGVATQCGILFMVLIGAVQSGLRLAQAETAASLSWSALALMVALALAIHSGALVAGYRLGRMLGFSHPDCVAVAFAGSQKTLLVGIKITLELGFSILPMVAYHVGQLVLDTLVADYFRRRNQGPE